MLIYFENLRIPVVLQRKSKICSLKERTSESCVPPDILSSAFSVQVSVYWPASEALIISSMMQIKINITFIKWDFRIYTIGEPHFCNKNHAIFVTKKTGPCNPAL